MQPNAKIKNNQGGLRYANVHASIPCKAGFTSSLLWKKAAASVSSVPLNSCFKVNGTQGFKKDMQTNVGDSSYLCGCSCFSEIPASILQRTALSEDCIYAQCYAYIQHYTPMQEDSLCMSHISAAQYSLVHPRLASNRERSRIQLAQDYTSVSNMYGLVEKSKCKPN